MENTVSMYRKAAFLEEQKTAKLANTLQRTIQGRLLQESDHRLVSPGVIRAIVFELTYIFMRHRSWHTAPLLSELCIDFLNSEYLLPHLICTTIVETCLDVIHTYTLSEAEWEADRIDQEFLEYLFICSIQAKSDEDLASEIGFGRNVIELLRTALVLGEQAKEEAVFQFAPELAGRLHDIIQSIFQEAAELPWILDLYKLKNCLQRDPYLRKNSLNRQQVQKLLKILQVCGPEGSTLADMERTLQAKLSQHELSLLIRNQLLFEEAQGRPQSTLYRLGRRAYELTSMSYAHDALSKSTPDFPTLSGLPPAYQSALVQLAWQEDVKKAERWFLSEAKSLSPDALGPVIDACRKNHQEETLLELFQGLLHNQAHAWVRAEICRALPVESHPKNSQTILESLVQDDPSPMVRSAARSALNRNNPSEAKDL